MKERSTGTRLLRIGAGLALLSLLLFSAPGTAAVIEGVTFPEQLQTRGVKFVLNGVGLLRWRVFFKGYVAALHLGENVRPEQVLGDVPKRLEIEYFWGIPASGFAEATIEGIGRNVDAPALEKMQPRIEELNALYRDVKPGDRYSLTYVPGKGTELALNGKALGTVEGADFAAALFSIWIGESPLSPPLKAELLGSR